MAMDKERILVACGKGALAWKSCRNPAASRYPSRNLCKAFPSKSATVLAQADHATHPTRSSQNSMTGSSTAGAISHQVLSRNVAQAIQFTPQERGALQDLSYGTLRYYSRHDCILDALLDEPLQDDPYAACCWLRYISCNTPRQGSMHRRSGRTGGEKCLCPAAGGLVNAVLSNFLRKQAALLEAADRKRSKPLCISAMVDRCAQGAIWRTAPLPFWKPETSIRR